MHQTNHGYDSAESTGGNGAGCIVAYPDSGALIAWELTANDVADVAALSGRLDRVDDRIEIFRADTVRIM